LAYLPNNSLNKLRSSTEYIGMLERSEAPGKRIKRIKKVFGPIKELL
jgi:hypothetical protein